MTQGHQILAALLAAGPSTYADLCKATGIPINSLRWAVNDLKGKKHVEQTEDPLNQAVAWRITPAGRLALAPAPVNTKGPRGLAAKTKTPRKKSVATVLNKIRAGKASATPAAGGANNSGSSAPESLVEAANTSPGGTAGDDARAGSHGPESAVGAADNPAASTVTALSARCSMLESGQLVIDATIFSTEFTRRLGKFMRATEPLWSQA